MPRGRKKTGTLEVQIENSKLRVEALTEKLREEKRKLADLQAKKKIQDQQAILDAFEKSGKSLEDILAELEGDK